MIRKNLTKRSKRSKRSKVSKKGKTRKIKMLMSFDSSKTHPASIII